MTTTDLPTLPSDGIQRLDIDPALAELRRQRPLLRVRLPYAEPAWLVTRYDDVKLVLGDPRFSRAMAVERDEPRSRRLSVRGDTIMSFDPPEHSRLRRLVTAAFTHRRVEKLRPRVPQIADELVDAMLAHGAPADLVEEFALPLPVTVICELLGVPYEDRGDFRIWSDAFLSTTKYTAEEVTDYVARMRQSMARRIGERREKATDDLISALVLARDEQDRLSEEELLSMAQGILIAGHETTASQIPNVVYVLLDHPDQLAVLRADLDLVPQAVEELMRYVPLGLGGGSARYAREDVELGGGTVHAGEAVVVNMPSANRDESVFTDPDTLNLTRDEATHVGFGHGPHHCLGASLARMELQVALGTLLSRMPGLRFAGSESDLVWKAGLATRGPQHMPIAWDQE